MPELKYAIEIVPNRYVYAEDIESAISTARMHADAVIREIVQSTPLLTFSDEHVLMADGDCCPQCYCCVRIVGKFVDLLDRRQEALKRSKGRDGTPEPSPRYEPAKKDTMEELEQAEAYARRIMQQRIESMKVLSRLNPRDL